MLLKQLVIAKKDNARLRSALASAREEVASLKAHRTRVQEVDLSAEQVSGTTPSQKTALSPNETKKYEDLIKRLKRLLAQEQHNLKHAKRQLAHNASHSTCHSSAALPFPTKPNPVTANIWNKPVGNLHSVSTPLLKQVFSFPVGQKQGRQGVIASGLSRRLYLGSGT